jgi:hypothetical protein
MKAQENIARRGPVVWSNYEMKLNQLDILFRFISNAFDNLSETKRRDFVRSLKQQAESEIVRTMEKMREFSREGGILHGTFDETAIKEMQARQQKKVKASFRGRTHTQYVEWVNDGMVSAEIVFRVTVFEDFMKHVHANMLIGNPSILGLTNKKRSVTFPEVFSPNFDKYREGQICREVKEVDRESMKYRLDYFAKHLGISLDKKAQWLVEISDIRNKIAHGSPLEAITNEDTTIPLSEFPTTVAKTLRDSMSTTFDAGKKKHPSHFLLK